MDPKLVWNLIFGLTGGLGIFLLGMKYMSEGVQAVAGQGLRRMISAVTNNRFMATGVGVIVTMLVQSSSITTVMVVGFVNGGLMNLTQGIGVIMGANIGTTVTGWLIIQKVGKFGLPLLGMAAFVYLFTKTERIRFIAMTIMGFGFVFFGLELMKDACSIIQDIPEFESWFHKFNATNYFGVFMCMLTGCLLTMAVQSSSATLGITISLAFAGVIPYQTAAALVLGENIGTTITAFLASLGATTNAKRAAYFHCLFNVFGVAWIFVVFFAYVQFVPWLIDVDVNEAKITQEVKEIVVDGKTVEVVEEKTTFPNTGPAIAMTHTIFNVTNTLVFLPFVSFFATLLMKYVPDKGLKEKPHLTNLDIRILETPVIAIEQSRVEVLRMGQGCNKMMVWLKEILTSEEPDREIVNRLFHREEVLDTIQDEIVTFMTSLLAGNVPHTVIEEGRQQLRMADEYESISDYITSIAKFYLKLLNQGHRFSESDLKDLLELHDLVDQHMCLIYEAVENRQPEVITKAQTLGSEIKHKAKLLHDKHIESLSETKIEPYVNVAYTATINSYRRVRDHAINLAEAFAGEK